MSINNCVLVIGLSICQFFIVRVFAKEFTVYWNIPSFMCQRYNLPYVNVTEKYGILQNDGDNFRGSVVSILYDPGKFPALLKNASSGKYFARNGGVPQVGSLDDHLEVFNQHINELIPDVNNNGLAVIDFESWRPVYRQNFGTLQPYKDLSVKLERQAHPFWSDRRIEAEASKRFEEFAQMFMANSIQVARNMRPYAKWGYYGLPYCFNGRTDNIEDCPREVQRENDLTQWLYDGSDVIYPSVYMNEKIKPKDRPAMVRGRVREALRLARNKRTTEGAQVIAYYRYLFTDTKRYLSQDDAFNAISAIKNTGADGMILWGSSNDLNSREKCERFYSYLDQVLGPIINSFGQRYFVQDLWSGFL